MKLILTDGRVIELPIMYKYTPDPIWSRIWEDTEEDKYNEETKDLILHFKEV